MKNILQILLLYCLIPVIVNAQFQDNFSDGNLNDNPIWQGDVDLFRVNELNELQLDAEEAGMAELYMPYELVSDFTWSLDVEMDFAPSNNNKLRIYFLADQLELTTANGYFLEIGENLSMDAVNIYRIDEGVETLLASGEMGAVGTDPALISLRMERVEGLWTISTDYNKQGAPIEEFNFFDDTYDFIDVGFFLIQTQYTSSNTKKFFFDNLEGAVFMPDVTGPQLVGGDIENNKDILLRFDEMINENSLDQLMVSGDEDNSLNGKMIFGFSSNEVLLEYESNWMSGKEYNLTINGLTDENGNVMEPANFDFVLTEKPQLGDLVINEILFDPPVDGDDFIEVINVSDKFLDLEGMILLNSTKEGSEELIQQEISLRPGEIVAFTEDLSVLTSDYPLPAEYYIVENDIPSLNKDMGNVTILNQDGVLLDSFDYNEDDHLGFIDETKGVSLERIFPDSPSSKENFASGVSSTGFATPGYVNANFKNNFGVTQNYLFLENEAFSPNEDGTEDLLIIQLNMPDISYLSTLRVFNLNGQLVKTIQTNQLTGLQDLARWDGSLDDGGRAPIGHYILTLEAFNNQGNVIRAKRHVKLLDFF